MNAIVAAFLNWLLAKILSFIGEKVVEAKQEQVIKDEAEQDKVNAQNASTPDERMQSAVDSAHDTFK